MKGNKWTFGRESTMEKIPSNYVGWGTKGPLNWIIRCSASIKLINDRRLKFLRLRLSASAMCNDDCSLSDVVERLLFKLIYRDKSANKFAFRHKQPSTRPSARPCPCYDAE